VPPPAQAAAEAQHHALGAPPARLETTKLNFIGKPIARE
jgi:hypothetical protein